MDTDCLVEKIICGKLMGDIPIQNTNGMLLSQAPHASEKEQLESYLTEVWQRIAAMERTRENLAFRPIYSCRKYVGKLIVLCKRIVRKCLKWYIEPVCIQQTEFNNAVTPAIGRLTELQGITSTQMKKFKLAQQNVEEQLDRISGQLAEGSAIRYETVCRTDQLEQMFMRMKSEIVGLRRQIEEMTQALEAVASLKETASSLEAKTEMVQSAVAAVQSETSALQGETGRLHRWQDDRDTKMQAIAREVIRTKWAFIDYTGTLYDESSKSLQCGICGFSGDVLQFPVKESSCIFDGGKLVRHTCPKCGVIFGPTKFSRQTKAELDDDYTVHYTGYNEGDSTEKEIKTFMLLHPEKDGIYLNYGCGSWSHSMQLLREQGYTIYGYEPYVHDPEDPFIITDKEKLQKMRFNGIFSQDVLEHLPDPAGDLRFMKSLLATPDSRMAHCTGCFYYKCEYTRFHMYFFTGNSLEVLCDQAGLSLIEAVDQEHENLAVDFHCRVFQMKEQEIDYLPLARGNESVDFTDAAHLHKGGICFGPYVTLPKGNYFLEVSLEFPQSLKQVDLAIIADSGVKRLENIQLRNGNSRVAFSLPKTEKQVEFVIQNPSEEDLIIRKITLVT